MKLAYQEIKKYGVVAKGAEIVHTEKLQTDLFLAKDKKGLNHYSKKLLLATRPKDNIPPIKGIENFYGKSILHCPYCVDWEVKEKLIGA